VKGKCFCEDDLKLLKEELCDFMRDSLRFQVFFMDNIPLEKSGKIRFCKSEIEN